MPSRCSSASRASWRSTATSRAPPSSSPRTGARTATCGASRRCCWSATPSKLLVISGNGDVIEPEHDVAAIGSGGQYALAAARALVGGFRAGCARDRRALAQHRRRHLHLHQPQPHHRGTERPPRREGLIGMSSLTPRQIVQELDKHIVGQDAAKRAVAIALRNRWRRMQVAGAAAPGDHAQEHPHDRPDRRRQDRDRAAPGASSPTRRSSRSRPPSSPRSATSAATSTRSSRSWPTSPSR